MYVGFFHLETRQNRRKRGEPRIGRKRKTRIRGRKIQSIAKNTNKQENW
jgi:hypothetical protein